MDATFRGRIALEGEEVAVALQVSSDTVRLATPGVEIGAWPASECVIRPNGDGSFELTVDGEQVAFSPVDPDRFSEALSGLLAGVTASLPGATHDLAPLPLHPTLAGSEEGATETDHPGGTQGEEDDGLPGQAAEHLRPPAPTAGNGRAPAGSPPSLPLPDPSRPGDGSEAWGGHSLPDDDLGEQGPGEDGLPELPGAGEEVRPASVAELGSLLKAARSRQGQAPEEGEEPTDPGDPLGTLPEGPTMADLARIRRRSPFSRLGSATVRKGMLVFAGLTVLLLGVWGGARLMGEREAPPVDPSPTSTAVTETTVPAPTSTIPTPTSSEPTPPTGPGAAGPPDGSGPGPVLAGGGPSPTSLFGQPAQQVLAEWNRVGGGIASVLRLPTSLLPGAFQEELTDHLAVGGTVDPDGSLGELVVSLDPSGSGASDLLGLQTFGVAIAVARPESDGGERAALLSSLGMEVQAPRLEGLDGEVTEDGVRYRLWYDPAGEMLYFSLAPA